MVSIIIVWGGPFFRNVRAFYEGLFGPSGGSVKNLGREGKESVWGPTPTPDIWGDIGSLFSTRGGAMETGGFGRVRARKTFIGERGYTNDNGISINLPLK